LLSLAPHKNDPKSKALNKPVNVSTSARAPLHELAVAPDAIDLRAFPAGCASVAQRTRDRVAVRSRRARELL
jgi:hypothetical protein